MRYSIEHKAKNHENILSVAARSFREHGGDSSGIGTVMKKVGLTKGGFYRHFKSKDDLFVEAVARALDADGKRHGGGCEVRAPRSRSAGDHRALSKRAPRELAGNRLRAFRPRAGTRAETGSRAKRIEACWKRIVSGCCHLFPVTREKKNWRSVRLLFPSMAGVLMMARVASAPQKREQMLMEARNFFIKCFRRRVNFFASKEYDRTLYGGERFNQTESRG